MEKGTLVEFRLSGEGSGEGARQPRLGVVDRPEGKKHWIVVDAKGQSHTLHPRQVTYAVDGEAYQPKDIPQFLQGVEAFLDPSGLEVAWEILLEDAESVTPMQLAALLYSDQSASPCYAAHRLLSEDKLYFKQKGDLYEPRSAAQVAELKHQLERQAQREQEQAQFQMALRQALAGEAVTWQSGDRLSLNALEKYALLGEEASNRTTAVDVLTTLSRPGTPEGAFQLLVDLGLWSSHENVYLRRAQLPVDFPDPIPAVVESVLEMPPPDLDGDRRDLTHLKVYTIDDQSTAEIDDGLSLEFLAEGQQRLWIHIADPSRWVTPGDELDREAQRRSTTVYLPTGMIPMFPLELSTGPMSLVQGTLCCALSFGVLLTPDGAVQSYEICPSQICPTYRLSYDDADEMLDLALEAEPELLGIAAWARQRQDWRKAQGAIHIQLPESSIKVTGDQVDIEVLHDSPSRTLVAEMMILAGEIAASYGEDHGLPLPFRYQTQPELPSEGELLQLSPGWVRACAIRGCMPRSEMGISPARHASLGLDRYCQVTSPIRRYTDLLAHFQIKAHLRGDPLPFNGNELAPLVATATTTAQEASWVERQTNRYWSLEYLRQHADQVWSAIVLRWLRERDNLALVLLEDLGLELAMRLETSANLGDPLLVMVGAVDPRLDRIQLYTCSPSTEESSAPPVS